MFFYEISNSSDNVTTLKIWFTVVQLGTGHPPNIKRSKTQQLVHTYLHNESAENEIIFENFWKLIIIFWILFILLILRWLIRLERASVRWPNSATPTSSDLPFEYPGCDQKHWKMENAIYLACDLAGELGGHTTDVIVLFRWLVSECESSSIRKFMNLSMHSWKISETRRLPLSE